MSKSFPRNIGPFDLKRREKLESVLLEKFSLVEDKEEPVEPVAPTLSTDIPDELVNSAEVEFGVTTTSGDKAGTMVYVQGTVNDQNKFGLKYQETAEDGAFLPLPMEDNSFRFGPGDGFPLADLTTKFKITPKEEGEIQFKLELKEQNGDAVLATLEKTINVTAAE